MLLNYKANKMTIRIEEYPFYANWLVGLLKSNMVEFNEFSPEFSDAYISSVELKIQAVDELVSTKLLIGDLSVATKKLYGNMYAARPVLLRLEGYVVRAKDELNVAVKNFGFSKIRKCIKNKDTEGFAQNLKTLIQLVDINLQILEAKGMKAATRSLLGNILTSNALFVLEQNEKKLAKEKVVAENKAVIKDLWNECQNITDAGKRIFRYSDPEMMKNFTKKYIMSTMRHDGKRKKIKIEEKKVDGQLGMEF